MKTALLFCFIIISVTQFVLGQELSENDNTEDHLTSGKHQNSSYLRIAIFIGHTFVSLNEAGDRSAIPVWGFDIEYWISHRWGFGLHNDLEIMNYVIERKDFEDLLEREYPLVVTADILYKPWKELILFSGIGKEFEVNENFFIYRIGIEYEVTFSSKWDISPSIFYDSRRGAFNTYSIMLGIGHRF